MEYTSEGLYIESQTTLLAKIAACEATITALMNLELQLAAGDVKSYMFNNGQTVINKVYRDPNQIANTVAILERRKQKYINDYNRTNITRFSDGSNFFPRY